MGDNRAILPNANIDYATTSRDDVSYEGAIVEWAIIGQTSRNANIDYATTSRYDVSYEGAIFGRNQHMKVVNTWR